MTDGILALCTAHGQQRHCLIRARLVCAHEPRRRSLAIRTRVGDISSSWSAAPAINVTACSLTRRGPSTMTQRQQEEAMLQLLPQQPEDPDNAEKSNDPTAILDRALAEAGATGLGAEQHRVLVVGPRLDAARGRDAAVGRPGNALASSQAPAPSSRA